MTQSPPILANAEFSQQISLDVEELTARLREAEETLNAIRAGEVDALVVGGPAGQQVYTLENADRPYRVLIEQMQEGAVTLSEDGTVLYCNQRFATIVAARHESLIGHSIFPFFREPEHETFRRLLARGAGTGTSREFTLRAGNGADIPVNISLVDLRVDDGMSRVVCGVVTDLTKNRRRNHELAAANDCLASEIEERQRAEDSLKLALDAAGMGSWDLDLDTGEVRRSLRHDEIFGYSYLLPNWSLQTASDHFLPEDREAVSQAFSQAETTGSIEFEARIRRAGDGAIRWLHVKGQTYYESERPVRIAGVVADVTDRKEVEAQLRQAQKIEAIGQLTGGVAHDFNNLLMVISGGLDMIERPQDPARRERILTGMRQAVVRGAGLSRQLLAFSRRQALMPESINLEQEIGGMRELLDGSLRGDVRVRTEFSEDLWPVEVDPGELELVVINLAVNARDAMPDGGTITIRAENMPGWSDGELAGDFVKLSVIDTGTGMTPDVLARVFEPFFTTKEVGKGSGLGLAQTHGFVRASDGAVHVVSAPGQGTTVSLFLPRTHKLPVIRGRKLAEATPRCSDSESAGRVLLVEDDDEVAALTAEMIQQLGYETMRVASAEAALGALANDRTIDVVFSDVMMPGAMNGVELAQEIHRRRPELPVLLTSGYAEAVQRSVEAQSIKILPKPYRLEELGQAFAAARWLNDQASP